VCPLSFEEVSAEKVLECFSSRNRTAGHQCLLSTCIVSRNGTLASVLYRCPPQYLCLLIQLWRQEECILPSLTLTRLMSSVSTLETLCIHSSKLQELACERNQSHDESLGCLCQFMFTDNKHIFQDPRLAPQPETLSSFSNLIW
jgi:hypothetical protein